MMNAVDAAAASTKPVEIVTIPTIKDVAGLGDSNDDGGGFVHMRAL